ncbi:hypothetical protein ACE6H2_012047 [Prunus campanulata]
MKKLLLPPLPLYLLPHFLQIATLLSAPIYTPVEDITINCGSSGTSPNIYDNRYWAGDINSKFPPFELHQANTNTLSQVREALPSSSVSQVPYTTARLSLSEFTCKVSLSTGQKFIRFYFHPVSYGPGFDRSKALFSVQAGGFTLLHDFNASVTADAFGAETLRREFCLNIDEGQSLTITFTPSRAIPDAYAFINGIEIVSMPTNLYYTASESHGVDYVGNEVNYRIENITAMEMVYRINVGGSALSFDQDTGMYRNWDSVLDEQKYLDDLSSRWSVLPQNVSLQLNFVKIPNYSAPDLVYQTGRSMGNNTRNKSYKNLTWEFPVDPKFLYLLRLHFCEFEPEIMDTGDRSFIIYVENQLAEPQADIIVWSGGNGRPIYRDYVVFMPAGLDQKKVKLFLALQANPRDWMTKYNDLVNLDDGRNWTGDINSEFSPSKVHQAASYTSLVREAPLSSSFASRVVPYNRSRLSRSEFTYTFNLTTGQKFIRLYFYPVSYGDDFDRSNAVFSVKAGGFTLLHNFNTSLTADASGMETIYREFCVSIEEGEKSLNITFTPSRASPDAHAFINGIEIVSMPRNLYYTPAYSDGADFVGKQINVRIENTTVLEMLYRLNVGGDLLLPKKDTGMYRKWDSYDEEKSYLDTSSLSLSHVLQQNTSIELNFNTIAKYTAPKEVYQTGRSMGADATINKSFNLTWQFPVDSEFSYLVRLHFCEFQPKITKVRDRIFTIQMVNLTAEQGADIIEWSGGNERPVYRDYLVSMPTDPGGTRKKVNLSLAMQANPNAGILNGLEIFKLSDLNGNLAGPTDLTPSSSVKHNTKSNRILAIAAGVASGLLVLSILFGFLIFRRRLKANTSKTHISTMVKGSFGYLDPEYYRRQRLTEKSDVYSFGVVLCEVLCARPAVMHTVELRQMNLAEWARNCHRDGELDQIIDPSIRGKIEIQCLNQFVEIAMSCMNDSGIERPSMNDVVRALELALQLHRNCIERNNEGAFVNDSTAAEIRIAELGCATDESIQCISETIFSEINDPNGR